METVHVARNLFLVSLLNFVMLALSFLDLFLSLSFSILNFDLLASFLYLAAILEGFILPLSLTIQ